MYYTSIVLHVTVESDVD